jgi:hypothetical protein
MKQSQFSVRVAASGSDSPAIFAVAVLTGWRLPIRADRQGGAVASVRVTLALLVLLVLLVLAMTLFWVVLRRL